MKRMSRTAVDRYAMTHAVMHVSPLAGIPDSYWLAVCITARAFRTMPQPAMEATTDQMHAIVFLIKSRRHTGFMGLAWAYDRTRLWHDLDIRTARALRGSRRRRCNA